MTTQIYTIYNDVNDKVYIGSTGQELNKRFAHHKSCANLNASNMKLHQHMREIGIECFHIKHIDLTTKENSRELEGKYIQEMKASLNQNVAGRSQKDSAKQWKKNNSERWNDYQKQWQKNNSDYHKEYYRNNRERCNEHAKQYYKNNKDHCKDYQRNYYRKNHPKSATNPLPHLHSSDIHS